MEEPAQFPKPCDKPREQAEQLLNEARKDGNRRREASALADMGVVALRAGDYHGAVTRLEESLALACQVGDPSLESDARINLGLALLGTGDAEHSRVLLEQQAAHARTVGDIYQEKIALDYLAAVHVKRSDHGQAITLYERALALAQNLGDRQHQAELLWMTAIQYAELGHRDQTIAVGGKAIDLYEKLGGPNVARFVETLKKYAEDDTIMRLSEHKETISAPPPGGYYTGPAARPKLANGPGLLWKALAAAQSMARFLGSGFKTVSSVTHGNRLNHCATCPYHTGVRCKVCGCFTTIKAWMPHEDCPIGKWSHS